MSGDGNGPTVEDRARYDALKKELMQALPSKRAVDKHLVRFFAVFLVHDHSTAFRPKSSFRYTMLKPHISPKPLLTAEGTLFKGLKGI